LATIELIVIISVLLVVEDVPVVEAAAAMEVAVISRRRLGLDGHAIVLVKRKGLGRRRVQQVRGGSRESIPWRQSVSAIIKESEWREPVCGGPSARACRALQQRVEWRRENPEIDVRVVEVGDQEHGHAVTDDPHGAGLVDLHVGRKHQRLVVAINDGVVLGRVCRGRVPAPDSVLVDEVEEHDAVVADDPRGGVGIAGSFLGEVGEVVVALLDTVGVAKDSRGDAELAVRCERREVERAEAVVLDRREGDALMGFWE
jgi:hypothetical protein